MVGNYVPVATPAPVIISSPLKSGVNWAAALTGILGTAAAFGYAIPPEWADTVIKTVVTVGPIAVLLFRNIFNFNKKPTVPQLKAAIEEKKV